MEEARGGWAANPKDGCRLHYRIVGNGEKTLVMLAGVDNHIHEWGWVPSMLADAGYRCILVDQRGSGLSQRPKRPWTIATTAGDVVAVMDQLKIDQADVIGFCSGGMTAQKLAMLFPKQVAGLVLVATAGGVPYRLPTPKGVKQALALPVVVHKQENPADVPRQLLAMATFVRPRLRRLAVRTLIVHGSADQMFPVSNARSLQRRIPGAQLQVLAGVSHLLPTTATAQLAQIVKEFTSPC